ncbi:nad(+) adp, partial [Cystoisospora suis]
AFEQKFQGLTGLSFADRFDAKQQPGRLHDPVDDFLHKISYLSGEQDPRRRRLAVSFQPIVPHSFVLYSEIQALLQENAEQKTTHKFIVKITDATNRFYNKIPHVFAHSAVPPVIDSLAKLRTKVEMMEQLLDVSVAHSLLDDAMKNARDKHPLDAQYEQLRCRLEPLTKSSEEWELIEKMLLQTHGPTHNTWTLKIQHVYKCEREGEKDQFQKDIGNRMLLWHGSRLTNWASILSQGLKVAPPEAPSSGYMFDKGLYFADMASKSSQYCFATSNSPEAILLLCEVALGKPYIRLEADYEASSHCTSKGLQSLLGVGKSCPNAKDDVEVASGVDGEKVKARTGKCSSNKQAVEEKQVFMRYLLHVKFEFATFDLDDDDEDSP